MTYRPKLEDCYLFQCWNCTELEIDLPPPLKFPPRILNPPRPLWPPPLLNWFLPLLFLLLFFEPVCYFYSCLSFDIWLSNCLSKLKKTGSRQFKVTVIEQPLG